MKDISLIKKFFVFLKPYKYKSLLAILLVISYTIFSLISPFFTKYIIDEILVKKSTNFLTMFIIILFVIMVAGTILVFLEALLTAIINKNILYDIRVYIFKHLIYTPMLFFKKSKGSGYLISRISDDVNIAQGLFVGTYISVIQNLLNLIISFCCCLYLSYKITSISTIILGFYILSLFFFKNRIRKYAYKSREAYALVNNSLFDYISGIKLIKLFSNEKKKINEYSNVLDNAVSTTYKLNILTQISQVASSFIASIGPIFILWYSIYEIFHGRLTIGGMIALNTFIKYQLNSGKGLFNNLIGIKKTLPSIERIYEILDIEKEASGKTHINITDGKINFKNIYFSYGKNKNYILNNLSLEISEKLNLIVGEVGAGKSTLISLIPKLHVASEGKIFIDNFDIQNAKLESLRKQISIVPQDNFLFNARILDNLTLGNNKITNNDIKKAAQLTGVDSFIETLPAKYLTKVNERGCNLSGGQNQLIAITRAILHDPKILIFDEATSNLDYDLQLELYSRLNHFFRTRTTIIISHNFRPIINIFAKDINIIVIKNGSVIDSGDHFYLYEESELYKNLFDLQENNINYNY